MGFNKYGNEDTVTDYSLALADGVVSTADDAGTDTVSGTGTRDGDGSGKETVADDDTAPSGG